MQPQPEDHLDPAADGRCPVTGWLTRALISAAMWTLLLAALLEAIRVGGEL